LGSIADVRVRGVDGCRGGWVSADVSGPGADVAWRWWPLDSTRALLLDGMVAVVAIDVPIGLPDAGQSRACDREARALLGRRGVSVFPAPSRVVLGAPSYAEARALLAARGGALMSAQAFGIAPAVAAVDACVSPGDDERIYECHPEVAFALMGGGPGLPGKRTADGAAVRRKLLGRWWPALGELPPRVPENDALDALACAWSALRFARGEAVTLGDGQRDARDLPMRIVG
jgi:predicted RNase H-like nuclease